MDSKLIKKSCKVCLALIIGLIAGIAVTKMLDSKKEDKQEDCGCSR